MSAEVIYRIQWYHGGGAKVHGRRQSSWYDHLSYISTKPEADRGDAEAFRVGDEDYEIERGGAAWHVRYAAERPGSEGLFGPDGPADWRETAQVLNHHELPAWRVILSMREEDAVSWGMIGREKWAAAIEAAMPDVTKAMRLDPDRVRWVAAYHAKYVAIRVQEIIQTYAAREPDWMRWWFELYVNQCGGQLIQGGENEAKHEEKEEPKRREVNGMAKLQVKNMHFFSNEQQGNLRAVCSLQVGDWVVNGVRVLDGKNGLFVALPGRQDKDGNYHDVVHPITKEGRESLNKVVLDHYQQGLSQQKEQAQEQVAER